MRWAPERASPQTPDVGGLAIEPFVRRALEGDSPTTGEIDAFLEGRTVPIVEGTRVTILFRGSADDVRLRHWVFGLPTANSLHRIRGTELWYDVLELPEGSRVEYKFEVVRTGGSEWLRDPLNPHLARDPFGANSVIQAAGYAVPEWAVEDPSVRQGTLEERGFRSRILGGTRKVTIYRPARFRPSRSYPLLLVHDGGDYLAYAGLKTVLDNLIQRLEIPGLVAALMHPHDRMEQYRGSEAHSRYLVEELVPDLEHMLPLRTAPESRVLMGASLGAVATLSTAVRYPDTFGGLLLQSGSFAFSDIGGHGRGPVFDPIADFVNDYRRAPTAVARRIFVSCGIYESLIYENRSLVPVLERTGMNVRFVESRDGHNWENWRDRLRMGLSWLLPGPLWLVYD
ncbi:MAG: enterochelin esterase [Gemmatimonadetes bacterium]|nr:enterochelin esterase [Gemmatimonadota bacterium]